MLPIVRNLCCLTLCFALNTWAHPGQDAQIHELNHLIELQPESQQLHILRGRIYAELQQFDQAAADFTRAEALGDDNEVALDWAALLQQQDQLPEARTQIDRYIRAFPNRAAAYEYRSRIAAESGDGAQAIADLERFFALSTTASPGHYIEAAQLILATGDDARALAVLDQAIDRFGYLPQLQRRAIAIELSRGNTAQAVLRWHTCQKTMKNSALWQTELAELLFQDSQETEARAMLDSAEQAAQRQRATPARAALLERIASMRQG